MEQNKNIADISGGEPSAARKKPPYVGFSFRQRLLPVLLLAVAAGFTVCFFGPADIFSNNADEFQFPLSSVIGWCLLYATGVSAAVAAILLPLRGRVFDIAYALALWLTLMLFLQGNYLNFGISSLTGDDMGQDGMAVGNIILNTVIWLAVGAGCFCAMLLLRGEKREWIPTVGTVAMITVLGMQLIPFAVNSLATDMWERNTNTVVKAEEDAEEFLSYRNMNKVSEGKNIIYFVIDRFDYSYYEDIGLNQCPEVLYHVQNGGFTYFDDMVSLYPRTFPSVVYQLTGIEHDFNDARVDYFTQAYSQSPFLKLLHENDYKINVYTDTYYGYTDIEPMKEYISNSTAFTNATVVNTDRLSVDMLGLSLFRYLPHAAKGLTGSISSSDFNKYVEYEGTSPKYTTDMRNAYYYLKDHPMETYTDGQNNFTLIHINGCHLVMNYDENFKPLDEIDKANNKQWDLRSAMIQSFKIINIYLDQLKELGLYEDATIVITGDHAWGNGSDSDDPSKTRGYSTALFFKESGKGDAPLVTNRAQVQQSDIIPTILRSEGIVSDTDFGKSLFDFEEGAERERRFCYQYKYPTGDYEMVWYKVLGRARYKTSWFRDEDKSGDMVGDIYD